MECRDAVRSWTATSAPPGACAPGQRPVQCVVKSALGREEVLYTCAPTQSAPKQWVHRPVVRSYNATNLAR